MLVIILSLNFSHILSFFFLMIRRPPSSPLFPYTPLFRSKFEQWGPVERQPLSHLRRTIAERMTLSATLVPHVTHFDRADMTELDAIIRRKVEPARQRGDRKSTRLNSSHGYISYAVFCLNT